MIEIVAGGFISKKFSPCGLWIFAGENKIWIDWDDAELLKNELTRKLCKHWAEVGGS